MTDAALALALALALVAAPATAKRNATEKSYADPWCLEHGGRVGAYNLDGTFTDCETLGYAIEADFVHGKFYEAIGQAMHYARVSDRLPGILLIVDGPADCRVLEHARQTIGLARYVHPTLGVVPVALWVVARPGACEEGPIR